MITKISYKLQETIAVVRNPDWVSGENSTYPFGVLIVIDNLKRIYPQFTFDAAVDVARKLSVIYHINYTIEKGL